MQDLVVTCGDELHIAKYILSTAKYILSTLCGWTHGHGTAPLCYSDLFPHLVHLYLSPAMLHFETDNVCSSLTCPRDALMVPLLHPEEWNFKSKIQMNP